MMKHLLSALFFLLPACWSSLQAQTTVSAGDTLRQAIAQDSTAILPANRKKADAPVSARFSERKRKKVRINPIDSISIVYSQRMAQLRQKYKSYKYTKSDTLANPYYIFLFAHPTYYTMPAHKTIGTLDSTARESSTPIPGLLQRSSVTPTPLINGINRTLSHVYSTHPQLIQQEEDMHLAENGLRKDINKEVKPVIKLSEKVPEAANDPVEHYDMDDWDIIVHRPRFWTIKANFGFEIMQYFYSDNWHKGGDNHYSWLASSVINANFNNKQKITFDNQLEMRLGFQSSKGDTKHKFLTNSDQIRMINKLGLRALKNWDYTLMLQSWTQFYPSNKKNDPKVYSDFMSPFESILTLGMNYKLNVKNFSFNAVMSPFAGNFKYVDRKALSSSFGLKPNRHSKFEIGSNITINYNWNIMTNVSWGGRIYYYTDYETTRIEWENTFRLKINKYLSTQLYVYPRFDDGVKRKEGDSYFQFHENLSLKLNYSF